MTNPQVSPPPNHTELWRLEQLALISQVATQVTSILDLDELLMRVAGLIYQTFQFYAVSLYTLENETLRLRAQAGPAGAFTVEDAFIPQEKVEVTLGEGIVGWVAAHQQELVVSDVWQERRFRYSSEFPNTQAEVALPLKVEDRLLGVLDVQLDYPEDFDESDLLVLRALAGQVSMATEDTRLYAEARRRGDYLATISAVNWAVASILDVDELLEQVSTLICKFFNYPFVQLFTVNYGRRQIEYRAGSGQIAELLKAPQRVYALDDPQATMAEVVRTGQTILINDLASASGYSPPKIRASSLRSELAIPLVYNDEVLGVLDVQSNVADAFSVEDRTIMEILGSNIAVALRNANLYHSERWRRQVADSLRRISGALITDVDLTNIFDTILTELKRNLPVEILAIWLIATTPKDADRKVYLSTVQTPRPFQLTANFDPEQDPWLAMGLEATEPLIRQNSDPPDPIATCLNYQPDHSAIITPLRVQNQMLGLLTLAHSEAGRYGRETRSITTAFANQAAIAIENARLFRIAQEEAQINSALLSVAEITHGFGDLSRALAAVAQIPPLMAEVDRCAIWLQQGDAQVFKPEAAAGFAPVALEFFNQYVIFSDKVIAAERLSQTQAPLIVVDAPADQRLPAEMVSGLALQTLVLLPLVAHNELAGLMLVSFISPAAIRDETIRLVTGVAHYATVAIEWKRLYDQRAEQERMAHELELAHDIQANLIPSRLPAPPGWTVAACWESAQEVAGDFYDFITVNPQQLGIVIADVAGKGMPAALYMALTRSLLRATAPGQTDPRDVLLRTNQLLVPDTQGGMFVSLFYAILETETGLLTYANAGHNPPLLIRANGQCETLHVPGLVLGILPEIVPQMGQSQLNPGDGVVFYTDGVTEVFNPADEIFGLERLKIILQDHWSLGPPGLITQVRQAVSDFRAAALLQDDFTLLILRRV